MRTKHVLGVNISALINIESETAMSRISIRIHLFISKHID